MFKFLMFRSYSEILEPESTSAAGRDVKSFSKLKVVVKPVSQGTVGSASTRGWSTDRHPADCCCQRNYSRTPTPDLWTRPYLPFFSMSPVAELSWCPVFRDEEEAPARVQLHPARQWLPGPLSAADPALLWKVRLFHSDGSKRGKTDSLRIKHGINFYV